MNQVKYILENFDFEKVHKVMKCLDWHWFSCEGVPNTYRLIKAAEEMLMDTNTDGFSRSSGGFRTEKVDGILYLSFVVEDWEGHEE